MLAAGRCLEVVAAAVSLRMFREWYRAIARPYDL